MCYIRETNRRQWYITCKIHFWIFILVLLASVGRIMWPETLHGVSPYPSRLLPLLVLLVLLYGRICSSFSMSTGVFLCLFSFSSGCWTEICFYFCLWSFFLLYFLIKRGEKIERGKQKLISFAKLIRDLFFFGGVDLDWSRAESSSESLQNFIFQEFANFSACWLLLFELAWFLVGPVLFVWACLYFVFNFSSVCNM